MRKMSKEKQKDYLQQKVEERKQIKQQIVRLSQDRNKYVAEKKKEAAAPAVATMNEAMTSAIQKQGEQKNFKFQAK